MKFGLQGALVAVGNMWRYPINCIWVVWKARNKRVLDRVEDADDLDILKNRWF